jgi:hypothetical protein
LSSHENSNLNEIISVFQNYARDPTTMIPLPVSTKKVLDHITKLVDVWEPTINDTI